MVHERIPAPACEDYKILGEPLKFRAGRTARNRLMKAALTECISTWDTDLTKRGIPTPEIINLYEKWGNGGFGVILTGNVIVEPNHLEAGGNAIICKENDSPELRAAFKKYASATKHDGALAVMQLSHAGRQTPALIYDTPKSASDVQLKGEVRYNTFGKPTPLTEEEIRIDVIDRFVFAAKVAKEAGFDGVQLHGAHGYLISQFISPSTNLRTDKYGGNPKNGVRLALEIYEGIREEIPADTGFVVGIKINSVEFHDKGLTNDDSKEVCALLEEVGYDFVELTGGCYEKFGFQHERESTKRREAFFLEFADVIRPVFQKTIVYVTGGFCTTQGMVDAIKGGSTDGIGLGRPTTAEPDLPKKLISGKVHSVPLTKFDQNDFLIQAFGCGAQMISMGKRSIKEMHGDMLEDIADFSDEREVAGFLAAAGQFLEKIKKRTEAKLPIVGVLEYNRTL